MRTVIAALFGLGVALAAAGGHAAQKAVNQAQRKPDARAPRSPSGRCPPAPVMASRSSGLGSLGSN